jgi:hypothetical protein
MQPNEKTLDETSNLIHRVERIAAAEEPAEVFSTIQSYLNSWSKERISSLQQVDGGWAPFDQNQRPSQINGVRDLRRICYGVHRQCVALRQAGMAVTPELIELDEILFIAAEMAESLKSPQYKSRSPRRNVETPLTTLISDEIPYQRAKGPEHPAVVLHRLRRDGRDQAQERTQVHGDGGRRERSD